MAEEDFKAIRITLSQEAFDRMDWIMRQAKFRSYSSTIEECIRSIYDVIHEIYLIAGGPEDPPVSLKTDEYVASLSRIIIRMHRLTARTVLPESYKEPRKRADK